MLLVSYQQLGGNKGQRALVERQIGLTKKKTNGGGEGSVVDLEMTGT
jgi:hypothetical protein